MKFQNAFFISALLIANLTSAQAGEEISNESVPVEIPNSEIKCSDAIPDHGFGRIPAHIFISGEKIFDRTLRVQKNNYFRVGLPKNVVCADLKKELSEIPESLVVNRSVYRIKEFLSAELNLEIPVIVAGKKLILSGSQAWIENKETPQMTYTSRAYPRAGTEGVGLFCKPSYEFSEEHQLSMGGVAGTGQSNVNVVSKTFPNAESCEEVRDGLLKRFAAEDPGNWGTFIQVNRKLETVFRYILDNEARDTCQQIELETVTTIIEGQKLIGVKAFILKTVSINNCGGRF